jgi:hypothetical protein
MQQDDAAPDTGHDFASAGLAVVKGVRHPCGLICGLHSRCSLYGATAGVCVLDGGVKTQDACAGRKVVAAFKKR